MQNVQKPSSTIFRSKKSFKQLGQNLENDKLSLVQRWKKQIDEDQERSVMRILEMLEIDYYAYGRTLPKSRYLLANS